MATLRRALRTLVVATALLAVIAPAAQAKPLETPFGPQHASAARATHRASGGSIGWAEAAIGAAITAVLIGAGVSGARLSRRPAVHA
jgi:hypothetical protein